MNQEDWMNRKWRPAMGWTYMVICILDFAVFPILWSILQAYQDGNVTSQWDPLTLKGAGLFHMAMGAVLGIAAWTRGQEKLANANISGTSSIGGVSSQNAYSQTITPTSSLPTPKPIARDPSAAPEDPPYRNTRND